MQRRGRRCFYHLRPDIHIETSSNYLPRWSVSSSTVSKATAQKETYTISFFICSWGPVGRMLYLRLRYDVNVSALGRSICRFVYAVSTLCPVYFSSPATLHLRSTTLCHPVSTDPYRPGVSRPVKFAVNGGQRQAPVSFVIIRTLGKSSYMPLHMVSNRRRLFSDRKPCFCVNDTAKYGSYNSVTPVWQAVIYFRPDYRLPRVKPA